MYWDTLKIKLSLVFYLITLVSSSCSFSYSLPGDYNWPKPNEFSDLKKKISGRVVFRGDDDYMPFTWNRRTNTPKPAVIVQPSNAQDIIEALKFAKFHNIRLSVMSTGHHHDSRNIFDNSVHIDMGKLNQKSIDLVKKTLTLGPGNSFRQIHKYVSEQTDNKLVVVSGADPGVGIYGWTSGGGHGALTKLYGLGVDSLISIDLILANLTQITVSESNYPELFRAIRGSGGGTYGIATSLTVKLHENPGVVSGFIGLYELANKTAEMFGNWLINTSNRVGLYFQPNNLGDKFVVVYSYCLGNESYCKPYYEPLSKDCIPVLESNISCLPEYEMSQNVYDLFNRPDPNGVVYQASTALNSSNIVEALKETVTWLDKNPSSFCSGNGVLGGISSTLDLSGEKTSVALEMRKSLMGITCVAVLQDSSSTEFRQYQVKNMDNFVENVFEKYSKWVFWNEPQHNFKSNDWKERYWGGLENYNRLLKVKKEVDPDNLFTCYHCIGYDTNEVNPSVCPNTCSCTNTPNGQCAYLPNIQWGNIVFKCNFDVDDCDGKFNFNSNGQQAGLFDSSNTLSTELGYDITDMTSLNSKTSSNKYCDLPFTYNSTNSHFCIRIQNRFKCLTDLIYSDCNLGKFFGVKTTSPTSKFDINYEKKISLSDKGAYRLEFYYFYNCYQSKSILDFFSSDCVDVKDRITVYTKYSENDLYSVYKQYDLTKKTSFNKWQFLNLNMNISSNELNVKIKFERLQTAKNGEAIFGLDDLSLIYIN